MIWSGVPQPWLGRSWNRPRLVGVVGVAEVGQVDQVGFLIIAAATAMIQPRTGTPMLMPTLVMVAALWTCSVSEVVSLVWMLNGVFSDGAMFGAASAPCAYVDCFGWFHGCPG